jgi:hypothetical protein
MMSTLTVYFILTTLAVCTLAAASSRMTACVLKDANSCVGKLQEFVEITDYNLVARFPQLTGTDAEGYSPPRYSAPTFYDLNGDGHDDLIAGAYTIDKLQYFATDANGNFDHKIGANNPFQFIALPEGQLSINLNYVRAAFFDADGDGDGDLAWYVYWSETRFFENIGTKTSPLFEERFNDNNPLSGISGGWPSTGTRSFAFVDLDGDDDQDWVIGCNDRFYYSENIGNRTAAEFQYRQGKLDPLHGIAGNGYPVPQFWDLDGDGDFDFLAASFRGITYYENTG